MHAQVPVDVATFLLNEKRAELFGMEERLDVSVFLIPNPHLENPHYEISRIRVDDMEDNAAPSYKRVTQPESSETVPFANKKGEKAMRPEPAVKGVHHASPPPVVASSSQSWWDSFKGWLKKLFGVTSSEPAAPEKKSSSRNERSGGTSNKRSNRRNKRRENNAEKTDNSNADSSNGNNGERKNSRNRNANANANANAENAEAKALMQPENAGKAEKEPRNSRNKGEQRNRNRNQQNAEKTVDALDENSVANAAEQQGQPEKEGGKKQNRNRKQKPVVVRLGDDERGENQEGGNENKRRRRSSKQNNGEAVRITVAPAPDSVEALAQRVREAVAHVLAIEAGKVPASSVADETGSLKTDAPAAAEPSALLDSEAAVINQAVAQVEQAQAAVLNGSLKTDEAVAEAPETADAPDAAALGSLKTDAPSVETLAVAAEVETETEETIVATAVASSFNLAEIVAASGLQFVETDAAALAAEAARVQPAPEPRLRRSDVPRAEAAVIAVEMIQVETRQG